jgi:hypothetical protein
VGERPVSLLLTQVSQKPRTGGGASNAPGSDGPELVRLLQHGLPGFGEWLAGDGQFRADTQAGAATSNGSSASRRPAPSTLDLLPTVPLG